MAAIAAAYVSRREQRTDVVIPDSCLPFGKDCVTKKNSRTFGVNSQSFLPLDVNGLAYTTPVETILFTDHATDAGVGKMMDSCIY